MGPYRSLSRERNIVRGDPDAEDPDEWEAQVIETVSLVEEGQYTGGQRTGVWLVGGPDGIEEGAFENGKRSGPWKFRDGGGGGAYREGLRQGAWQWRHQGRKGSIAMEVEYVAGKKHGGPFENLVVAGDSELLLSLAGDDEIILRAQ